MRILVLGINGKGELKMQSCKKCLILFGLIFLVVYTAHRVAYAFMADPTFCVRCHEVAPYVSSWEKYPHSNIDCRQCHETRGLFRRLDFAVRGIRDIGIHFKGDFSFPMRAVVYDVNCINCHLGTFEPESKAPILPKDHKKLIKSGVGCNNCHRDTGHKNGLGVDDKFESINP